MLLQILIWIFRAFLMIRCYTLPIFWNSILLQERLVSVFKQMVYQKHLRTTNMFMIMSL